MGRNRPGKFVFRRPEGDEVYDLESATLTVICHEEEHELLFQAQAVRGAVQAPPEAADHPLTPNAEVSVFVPTFDVDDLVGRRFSVLVGYDEDREDHVATVYYHGHQDLNDNAVEVLARNGKVFQVRWRATTGDVDRYDGSAPDNRILVEGWFTFRGVEDAED